MSEQEFQQRVLVELTSLSERVGNLEGSFQQLHHSFGQLESSVVTKIDNLTALMARTLDRFESRMEERFIALEKRG